jgi:lysophospholipase L1-like esterase
VPLRLVGALYIPIFLLLLPFAGYHSSNPVFLIYSWDYLLFLIGLALGGLALAFTLALMVRKAPVHRQLTFGLILLGIPVIMLLAVEAYLTYREPDAFAIYREWGHIKSPLVGFEAAPNHHWEQMGAVYSTDANTFRTHVAPRVAGEREILIVAMGGSDVFGYGLNDDETWPHRLEEILRKHFGEEITVINASNNGHNTLQQLIRMYVRVLPLEPDYIIFYGAINDIYTAQVGNRLISMPDALVQASSTRDYIGIKNRGKGFYLENSLLINYLRFYSGKFFTAPDGGRPAVQTVAVKDVPLSNSSWGYIRNIQNMHLMCKEAKARFIPVTLIADMQNLPESVRGQINMHMQALREHCRKTDVPLVDLHPAFGDITDKADLFFEDHYHPSRRGARFIAEQLAEALAPMIAQDRSVALEEDLPQ